MTAPKKGATGPDALLQALQGRAAKRLSASERQEALVSRLLEMATTTPLVHGGDQGRRVAQWVAEQGMGERAQDFMAQLGRIDEAQRVLDLAWTAGEFADCIRTTTTVFTRKGDRREILDMELIQDTCAGVKQRAYELLAEQYPDIRVRVDVPNKWETDKHKQGRNWCRVLGGPEK
jgi:hypothetical protein